MKRLLLFFCIIIIVNSCTKSDNSENLITKSDANFFALTVGNSWVYKNYQYNLVTETYDDTGVIDSISIVGIQDFSGETYYKFRTLTTGNEDTITFCNPNGESFEFLREFEGNLINEEGSIKFTNSENEERLLQENEWGNVYETLLEGITVISVEAGEFDCIKSERYAKNLDNEQLPGLDHFYYSNGIGLIYDTSSFVSKSIPTIIRRLDFYEVQ
ncbi:hypothetical protein [uncultured Olleya sp.]|uniref:hypothetical protein n=1 Tax=uncultured Olleya sp. TaxID=757243 RepID=UPI0025948F3D|nr:hypothetical protein [uncultured Olleya sp.]